MIKCGHCKGRHTTVNEVRQCAAPVMPSATRAPVHPVRLRDAVDLILTSAANAHIGSVPTITRAAAIAGIEHTVRCSCGQWARTMEGTSKMLWDAFDGHLRAELAAEENQPERDLAMSESLDDIRRDLALPATEGMYAKGGEVYKVQRAVHGSGHLYVKRLDKATQSFEYAPGILRQLTMADRMTLAEAKAYGALYGVCCVCARTLTNEESIAAGIGPVCAGRLG